MTDAASSKAVVRAHFEVLNTGDYPQLDALHDAEGRNHAPAAFDLSPQPAEGRPFGPADVRATFEWLRGALPDLHVSILDLIAEGDLVVARVHMSGTQTGDFGSVPATGKTVDFQHVHIFRLDNARIVEHWAVRDDLRAMLQLGVVAQPGATQPPLPAQPAVEQTLAHAGLTDGRLTQRQPPSLRSRGAYRVEPVIPGGWIVRPHRVVQRRRVARTRILQEQHQFVAPFPAPFPVRGHEPLLGVRVGPGQR